MAMNFRIDPAPLEAIEADAAALVLFEAAEGESPAEQAAEMTGGLVRELYESREFTGKALQTAVIHRPAGMKAKRLILVGGGKPGEFSSARLRQAAGAAVRTAQAKGAKRLALSLAGEFSPHEQVQALAEGALLGGYEPDAYKTQEKPYTPVEEVLIASEFRFQPVLDRAVALATAQNFARGLVNEPGNLLTPSVLAQRGVQMSDEAGLAAEVLRGDRIAELKMGGLQAVAQGSAEPPVMLVLRYRPETAEEPAMHLGLAGKAVTFDTGGISIKPSQDLTQDEIRHGGRSGHARGHAGDRGRQAERPGDRRDPHGREHAGRDGAEARRRHHDDVRQNG